MGSPPLIIDNLTVFLGRTPVLNGLNLSLPGGMARFLLGPNGAGKTTLLNAISGLVPVRRGAIYVGGENVTMLSPSQRAKRWISRSFQHPTLAAGLTCLQHLLLAVELSRSAWALLPRLRVTDELEMRAELALSSVGMTHASSQRVSVLNHAERKLLDVLLALTSGAPILLLDEPAAGLDLKEKRLLSQLITGVQGERTILIVEHDLEFIKSMGLPVVLMKAGQIAFSGEVSEVSTFSAEQHVRF